MTKVILLTGATDGIGLEAAKRLAALGHHVLMHGRSPTKLADAADVVRAAAQDTSVDTFLADLSRAAEVDALATAVSEHHERLDVVINNAGVLKVPNPMTEAGLDIRFVVPLHNFTVQLFSGFLDAFTLAVQPAHIQPEPMQNLLA